MEDQVRHSVIGSYLFIGVSQIPQSERDKDPSSTCVGYNPNEWSYAYGYKWNGDNTKYGKNMKDGDVIECIVDMKNHTIAWIHNGTNLGIAFNDLPKKIFPAVSLLQGSKITLMNNY